MLRLHYLEGYELREIANKLNIALGTVKRRLHDARKQMKEVLFQRGEKAIPRLKYAVGLETGYQDDKSGEWIKGVNTRLFGTGMPLPAAVTIRWTHATDNQAGVYIHSWQCHSRKC